MWFAKQDILDKNVHKVRLFDNETPLRYEDVIRYWQENFEFRTFYSSILEKSPFDAYFWEHPPITRSTINQAYEFVLINSPQLSNVTADSSVFQNKIKSHSSNQSVIAFENLGRDAELIVPIPVTEQNKYAHIAAFLRNAPEAQKHELFTLLGILLKKRINDKPTWVSTSGLGVYWLHIRLDTRPKYYSYQAYRRAM